MAPPFYGPFQPLGILTGGVTGLQHALAMAGGLVTPPILIGTLCPDPATRTCEASTTGLGGLGGGGRAADARAKCAAAELRRATSSRSHSLQTRPVAPHVRPNGTVQSSSSSLTTLTTLTTSTTCRPALQT